MWIKGTAFGKVRDWRRRRRKGGVTKKKGRDKQSNALIINLWLSSGVETCASGKGIEAENNMKR